MSPPEVRGRSGQRWCAQTGVGGVGASARPAPVSPGTGVAVTLCGGCTVNLTGAAHGRVLAAAVWRACRPRRCGPARGSHGRFPLALARLCLQLPVVSNSPAICHLSPVCIHVPVCGRYSPALNLAPTCQV